MEQAVLGSPPEPVAACPPAGHHVRRRGGVPPRRPGDLPADPQPRRSPRPRCARSPAAHCTPRSPRPSWRRSPASARACRQLRAELVTTRAEAAGGRGAGRGAHPRRLDPPVRQLAAAGHHARRRATRRWSSGGPGWPSSRTSAAATCTSASPTSRPRVAVMDRARPYLPVLLAMTGSSPFHDGVDTGYDSYRTMWWSRWPTTGPPEYLGSAERFHEVVAGLVASGVIADALAPLLGRAALLATCRRWSSGWPTSAPTSTTPSCTRRWSGRWCGCSPPGPSAGEPCPQPRPELLRAARWRAARHGLGGQLFDPVLGDAGATRGSPSAGCSPSCEDDLRDHDEWTDVGELVERLFARGTSAVAAAADLAAHRRLAGGGRPDRPRGHRPAADRDRLRRTRAR